jgi:hypothetical protein
MLMSPVGLRPERGCTGDAQQKLKTTDPTSLKRSNCNYIKIIKERRRKFVCGSQTPRQTGQLTTGRNELYFGFDLILSSGAKLRKDNDSKNISALKPRGDRHRDEVIGGKPPVVKLTVTVTKLLNYHPLSQ